MSSTPGPLYPKNLSDSSPIALATESSEPQRFSGMAFPFGGTVLSTFGAKTDEAVIRSSLDMIIHTLFGERVMLPEFGSHVPRLVFDPNDNILAITLRSEVESAILTWEPRISLGQVEVEPLEDKVVVRISALIPKPDGLREVDVSIELERETLYNMPFGGLRTVRNG
jgi:phage baseplate assembly protein W